MSRFAAKCQTTIPPQMARAYRNAASEEEHDLLSIATCCAQCDDLMEQGVEHLHFYTMNKPDLPYQVCRAIGVEPQALSVASGCS
jgi:methylenetetrahydrofolate reductase (NADPH)